MGIIQDHARHQELTTTNHAGEARASPAHHTTTTTTQGTTMHMTLNTPHFSEFIAQWRDGRGMKAIQVNTPDGMEIEWSVDVCDCHENCRCCDVAINGKFSDVMALLAAAAAHGLLDGFWVESLPSGAGLMDTAVYFND